MSATQTPPRYRSQRKGIPLTVTHTEIADCGRIMTQYGEGEDWGKQPAEIAYLRENTARPSSGLPKRVLSLLLFNGKAQRLADYVDARRREKLGQSHAADIPTLIVEETQAEADADVLEVRELAGTLDRAGEIEAAERLRTHAHRALALSNALLDKAHGVHA